MSETIRRPLSVRSKEEGGPTYPDPAATEAAPDEEATTPRPLLAHDTNAVAETRLLIAHGGTPVPDSSQPVVALATLQP